jgi:type VI secretion system protein ImpH
MNADRDAEVARVLQQVAEEPYRYDLWQLLRWLDAKHPEVPPLGRSPVPDLEPLRIGQEPSPGGGAPARGRA